MPQTVKDFATASRLTLENQKNASDKSKSASLLKATDIQRTTLILR